MPIWRGWESLRTGLFGSGFMVASLCLIGKLQSSKNDDHHPLMIIIQATHATSPPSRTEGVHDHPSLSLERSDVPNRGFAPRVAVFFRKTTLAAVRRNRFFSAP